MPICFTGGFPAVSGALDALARHLIPDEPGGTDRFVIRRNGTPVDAAAWEAAMRSAHKRASVEDVTFHDLRHFYASALISAGCSVKAIQSALGHRSAAMTLDVYGHLFPGDEDRIRDALEGRIAKAAAL